ncbi:MAG: YicC family protein [Oscillospiraceae bacterium]|nr:YicC family protein [Oscillospiraceae bacterium]
MIKSMTGYGRGEAVLNGRRLTAQVRSVNNRYLDCAVKLPRGYLFAEDAVRGRVSQVISRGKVDVIFTIDEIKSDDLSVTVNEPLALAYLSALRQLGALGEKEEVSGPVGPVELAQFPGVLTVEKKQEDTQALQADICAVLDLALEDIENMRQREGERMAADILCRAQRVEDCVLQVEQRSPQTVAEHQARLEEKLRTLLQTVHLDESRLLTEAAIFADKTAVDEETVRLRSHLAQLREMLNRGGAIGRKLDFLIQEFNREANTIGSKCSDIKISRLVVDMKAEIEKMREQVQNIE